VEGKRHGGYQSRDRTEDRNGRGLAEISLRLEPQNKAAKVIHLLHLHGKPVLSMDSKKIACGEGGKIYRALSLQLSCRLLDPDRVKKRKGDVSRGSNLMDYRCSTGTTTKDSLEEGVRRRVWVLTKDESAQTVIM